MQVLAIAVNSGLVAYPLSYKKIGYNNSLSIWAPQAPEGFLAMGHIVTEGSSEPAVKDVVCLHASRVTETGLAECLNMGAGDRSPADLNIWNVDNSGATFLACQRSQGKPTGTHCMRWSMVPSLLDQNLPKMRSVAHMRCHYT